MIELDMVFKIKKWIFGIFSNKKGEKHVFFKDNVFVAFSINFIVDR